MKTLRICTLRYARNDGGSGYFVIARSRKIPKFFTASLRDSACGIVAIYKSKKL
ncbi:hypothetical protein [Helicobacter sp.]|uniref:hypothetical protein n=1 Tax=Helicobacter sp. TaxID=218 RepID=UPI002A909DDA|nr:hypothetical protein [Helicobacter sp.]